MNYLKTCLKLQFRVPTSVFFSLVFPVVIMTAMVLSYGNFSIGDGYHFVDKYFLISTGMGLLPISIISFPIWIGESIQNDSYERLEYLGVNTTKLIVAEIFSYIVLSVISISTNIVYGYLVFSLKIPSIKYLISFVLLAVFCNMILLLLGANIAKLVKSTSAILPLGMILLFTMYIFTGALTSFSDLPIKIQNIGDKIPIKYVMNDFFSIWSESKLVDTTFIKLNFIWGAIFIIILIVISKMEKEGK